MSFETGAPILNNSSVRCILESPDHYVQVVCNGETRIPPGLYALRIHDLPEDVYVASAEMGGENLLLGRVSIDAESKVSIRLGRPGATVSGNVQGSNGEQIANAAVVLVPFPALRTTGLRYRSGTSDIRGRFELKGIAPGNYLLFAWQDIEGAAYRNPEFMGRFEGRGREVHIESDERQSMNIRLLD
jgi:hypothetical protein